MIFSTDDEQQKLMQRNLNSRFEKDTDKWNVFLSNLF